MRGERVHICSFQAGPDVEQRVGKRWRRITYDALKAAVVKAGRFSVFEATATQYAAGLYTALCADPTIETWDMGFPWTGVRAKRAAEVTAP